MMTLNPASSPKGGSFDRHRPTKRPTAQVVFGLFIGASVAGLVALLLLLASKHNVIASVVRTAASNIVDDSSAPTHSVLSAVENEHSVPLAVTNPSPTVVIATSLTPSFLHRPAIFPHDFWFVKTKKVGGSTLKGIFNAICAHQAMICMASKPYDASNNIEGIPWDATNGPAQIDRYRSLGFEHLAIVDHGKYSKVLAEHLKNPLLFTAVRDPVDRVISQFFFTFRIGGAPGKPDLLTPAMAALSRGEPIPEEVLTTMKQFAVEEANLVFKDISDTPNKSSPHQSVAPYDFIFVQEKFDESLIVFAIEYGLSFRDLAYISAKNQTGKYPVKEQLPPDVVEYIQHQNQMDAEVYTLASDALEARVAALRDAHAVDPLNNPDFDALLTEFKALQAKVVETCTNYEDWYAQNGFNDAFFYSQEGGAVGEGFRCFDYVARRWEAGIKE